MKPEPQKTKLSIRIYRSRDGFRWRGKHRNGKIIEGSTESYHRKGTMTRILNNFIKAIAQGDYEVRDETKK